MYFGATKQFFSHGATDAVAKRFGWLILTELQSFRSMVFKRKKNVKSLNGWLVLQILKIASSVHLEAFPLTYRMDTVYMTVCVIEKNAQFDWTREQQFKFECASERYQGCKRIFFVDRDLVEEFNERSF